MLNCIICIKLIQQLSHEYEAWTVGLWDVTEWTSRTVQYSVTSPVDLTSGRSCPAPLCWPLSPRAWWRASSILAARESVAILCLVWLAWRVEGRGQSASVSGHPLHASAPKHRHHTRVHDAFEVTLSWTNYTPQNQS